LFREIQELIPPSAAAEAKAAGNDADALTAYGEDLLPLLKDLADSKGGYDQALEKAMEKLKESNAGSGSRLRFGDYNYGLQSEIAEINAKGNLSIGGGSSGSKSG
jgi:hypothetical protein